jgi:RNA polymerase sigma-70 factor (ECF subfamily)
MLAVDEATLMAGVARLDPLALVETHYRFYPEIFRFIASKVGNHETAEDMTSDVFVRLLDAVQDCRAPEKTLRGWLYCVASRMVNDYFRRQYTGTTVVEFVDSYTVGDTDEPVVDQVVRKETLEALHQAIGELTDEQQQVVQLRYGFEMSICDVAAEMGKSEGAVKQLQARAVASLARKMILQTS